MGHYHPAARESVAVSDDETKDRVYFPQPTLTSPTAMAGTEQTQKDPQPPPKGSDGTGDVEGDRSLKNLAAAHYETTDKVLATASHTDDSVGVQTKQLERIIRQQEIHFWVNTALLAVIVIILMFLVACK
jgi:hypothetical protein